MVILQLGAVDESGVRLHVHMGKIRTRMLMAIRILCPPERVSARWGQWLGDRRS
jgi:hypothetical protein